MGDLPPDRKEAAGGLKAAEGSGRSEMVWKDLEWLEKI